LGQKFTPAVDEIRASLMPNYSLVKMLITVHYVIPVFRFLHDPGEFNCLLAMSPPCKLLTAVLIDNGPVEKLYNLLLHLFWFFDYIQVVKMKHLKNNANRPETIILDKEPFVTIKMH
jgi:hypothetical protein